MHHGILLGLASTIEVRHEESPRQLILTGGDAQQFAKHLQAYAPVIEPDLLSLGRSIIPPMPMRRQKFNSRI